MACIGGASIALGSGGNTRHAAAFGFSAVGRESLWKIALTVDMVKRHKLCINQSATIKSVHDGKTIVMRMLIYADR